PPLPPAEFSTFILSLSTAALVNLGEMQNPVTGEAEKDVNAAKHTIDIIGMLGDRTKGNLSEEETRFLDGVLADLRLKYCKAVE
ncbi:MAG: DUF1844 domain-containing protein, partial [Thermodesulfobacteriota bacterium]